MSEDEEDPLTLEQVLEDNAELKEEVRKNLLPSGKTQKQRQRQRKIGVMSNNRKNE